MGFEPNRANAASLSDCYGCKTMESTRFFAGRDMFHASMGDNMLPVAESLRKNLHEKRLAAWSRRKMARRYIRKSRIVALSARPQ